MRIAASTLLALLVAAAGAHAIHPRTAPEATHVVLISIDGLRGDYLGKADTYGLRIPNLRRLIRAGTFSDRTLSVFPSLTLTAHTTLVTGATAARHGILGNNKFDMSTWVFRRNQDNYDGQPPYRDYANIRAETLWSAARARGLRTTAISWPATEGGPIDYRLDMLSDAAVISGRADERAADRLSALAAADLLKRFRPALTAVHFGWPDRVQHATGPLTREALEALEESDADVGLVNAAIAESGLEASTTLIVTGDHGFLPVHADLAINLPLVEAGLIAKGVRDHPRWTAVVEPHRGLGSLYVRHPADDVTASARRALQKYETLYPGRFRIVEREELDRFGADAEAVLGVEPLPGYLLTACLGPPFERASQLPGGHGYRPDRAGMETAFVAVGPGVRANVRLPVTNLIDVAPTIALMLGLELPDAEGMPIFDALTPTGLSRWRSRQWPH